MLSANRNRTASVPRSQPSASSQFGTPGSRWAITPRNTPSASTRAQCEFSDVCREPNSSVSHQKLVSATLHIRQRGTGNSTITASSRAHVNGPIPYDWPCSPGRSTSSATSNIRIVLGESESRRRLTLSQQRAPVSSHWNKQLEALAQPLGGERRGRVARVLAHDREHAGLLVLPVVEVLAHQHEARLVVEAQPVAGALVARERDREAPVAIARELIARQVRHRAPAAFAAAERGHLAVGEVARVDLELDLARAAARALDPIARVSAHARPRVVAVGVVEAPAHRVVDHAREDRVVGVVGLDAQAQSRGEEAREVAHPGGALRGVHGRALGEHERGQPFDAARELAPERGQVGLCRRACADLLAAHYRPNRGRGQGRSRARGRRPYPRPGAAPLDHGAGRRRAAHGRRRSTRGGVLGDGARLRRGRLCGARARDRRGAARAARARARGDRARGLARRGGAPDRGRGTAAARLRRGEPRRRRHGARARSAGRARARTRDAPDRAAGRGARRAARRAARAPARGDRGRRRRGRRARVHARRAAARERSSARGAAGRGRRRTARGLRAPDATAGARRARRARHRGPHRRARRRSARGRDRSRGRIDRRQTSSSGRPAPRRCRSRADPVFRSTRTASSASSRRSR